MAVHGTHNAVADNRNEDILIYVNGELFKRHEAKISVFDSGYLVGDGIWEALRLYDGVLVFLDEHLDRLWQAAATVGMNLNMTRQELLINSGTPLKLTICKTACMFVLWSHGEPKKLLRKTLVWL